ncbi:hypothetical protein ACFVX3_18120 [Rhodococcus erythropolis]
MGPVGARRVLSGIGIDEVRRLGGLGVRQRRDLVAGTAYPLQRRRSCRAPQ